ncbi:MAG: Asp-tRNA(Asn)/Glu-tRNA(Gln) amidotransferase subunit GatC [Actinomycetota bacterium]|nr:Asp-tRNA(Asn)/Glu-tRNA(Gln) amidotransferase subunit GatC [Actinomycetota bacterium]
MPLDRHAVDHVARLARLDLSDQERVKMQSELSHILEHVERIQALDLDNVEPTSHAIPLANVMRPDVVRGSLSQQDALSNAPEATEGGFKVRRILEDE